MSKATLSVVMSSYNHAVQIAKSLDAFLSQSRKADEIIVIDDVSTDNSVQVISKYAAKDPTVRLIKNEKNTGVTEVFNRGIREAKSDYIFLIGSDDLVLPGFFEKTMAMLEQYPQAGMCCSHPAFVDGVTEEIDRHENWYHYSDRPKYFSPQDIVEALDLGHEKFWIAGHTCIIKRKAMLEAGLCKPELKWHSDWFMGHVIAFRQGVCYIPEALSAWRTAPVSYSSNVRDPKAQSEVLWNMTSFLNSAEYADVKYFFERSKLLDCFSEYKEIMLEFLNPRFSWERRLEVQRQLAELSNIKAKLTDIENNLHAYNDIKKRLSVLRPVFRTLMGR